MDYKQFAAFNKKLCKKMFGNFIKSRRSNYNLSVNDLSKKVDIAISDLKLIECGTKNISQKEFDALCLELSLSDQELLEITKIAQVQYIGSLFMDYENEN